MPEQPPANDPASRLREQLLRMPKTELHLHLEGAVTPETVAELADRHSTELAGVGVGEVRERMLGYADFHGFLDSYGLVCRHLVEPDDYQLALERLAGELRRQNVVYAEVIYTPSIPWRFERDGQAILEALLDTGREIESGGGPRIRWILDCVRQWGDADARRTAELGVLYRERGVVALGLGGDELALPMADFRETYQWAKAQQLHIHIHAGEIGGPEQIWDALKLLGANRIGHGIQAARDPRLMDYLKEHAIGLDVCLTSNVRTGAWKPLSQHPFPLLLKRGVPVSINTDDPALFDTDLTGEYELAVTQFGLSRDELTQLVLHSVNRAFLPHDDKMALMGQVREAMTTQEVHK